MILLDRPIRSLSAPEVHMSEEQRRPIGLDAEDVEGHAVTSHDDGLASVGGEEERRPSRLNEDEDDGPDVEGHRWGRR
jgi:hypothetical protein